MSELYFDHRWCAPHGIGRFATEVRRRLQGFTDLPLGGSPTSPLDALRLAGCLRKAGCKGLFTPGFNVAAWSGCKIATTIHDLIHVHFADEASAVKLAYYRYVQRPVVRRSPVTLTVSEYSRQQIIDWYGVPESRVVVVGNGVSEEFSEQGDAHQSATPYFLYVGNAKPHKNVGSLLRAFAMVAAAGDVKLKLVTRPNATLRKQISEMAADSCVEFCPGLDDTTLATLYRGATGLVLPSHFEGFGLPLVEAMACGCPVIASNRTSIPEVLGNAGILFEPDDAEQLADAMKQMIQHQSLRETMIRRGLVRAREFRWDNVAGKVQAALAPITG